MTQERMRLEKQLEESEEQLRILEKERKQVQEQVRKLTVHYFGTVSTKRRAAVLPSIGSNDASNDSVKNYPLRNQQQLAGAFPVIPYVC